MFEFLKDIWLLMKERRKFWLLPIITVLLLIGVLVIAQSSVLAPFIYAIF